MAAIPGDPFTSFFSSFGGGLGKGLGDGIGGALGGDPGPNLSSASSATWGTSIGNSGWSVNMGSGSQVATPTATNTATYPQDAQYNPLNSIQRADGVLPVASASSGWLMVGLVGFIALKALRG